MTSSQRIVLILLVVSLLAGLVTGAGFYYRLSYVWAILYGGSWLLSRLSLRGVKLERRARFLRSQVGQIFEERYEITNTSRLPRLWLEVRDESTLPGSQGSQVLSLIGGRESRSYLVRTRLMQRGVFHLGPTILASGDIFGLFPASVSFSSQDSLLVYPMMVDIKSFPSPMGWLSGGEALRRRTHQITANASGVREYAPGDPLNRIHWLSTARRNRLIVKEFELDPLAEVWLFLDAARYVHASLPYTPPTFSEREIWRPSAKVELPPSTEEYAVSVAASLARYYLRRGRTVGLVSAGKTLRVIQADKGGRQLGKILEALALLKADGTIPLQGLMETELANLPRGSTIVMITPSGGESVTLAVELVARRGMRPIVVMLDSTTFGGMLSSRGMVKDLETMNVPVIEVKHGDDLSDVLSHAHKGILMG